MIKLQSDNQTMPKRRGRPPKQKVITQDSISTIPPTTTSNETNKTIETNEECLVCTEQCVEPLACGHSIHQKCIAMSGQSTCSVCRKEIQFNEEDQALYEKQKSQIEKERKEQEHRDSIRLAHQLQRELNGSNGSNRTTDEDILNVAILKYNGRNFRVTLRPMIDALSSDELMLQLNSIMYNINNKVLSFTTDQRALELYKVLVDMNRISE